MIKRILCAWAICTAVLFSAPVASAQSAQISIDASNLKRLASGLDALMDAYDLSGITGMRFWLTVRMLSLSALRETTVDSVVALSMRPEHELKAWIDERIGQVRLKSAFLKMSFEDFENLNGDERRAMVDRFGKLIALYRAAYAELMQKSKGWSGTSENMPKAKLSIDDLP
jgi:hypothetical protein